MRSVSIDVDTVVLLRTGGGTGAGAWRLSWLEVERVADTLS